jgi:enoyl-CoA hydratase/carnithine racemase
MNVQSRYGQISVLRESNVAMLEIDRPPNNHVSAELLRDLADALDAIDESPNCRAVVMASAGKSFCAGAELAAPSGPGQEPGTGGVNPLYEQAVRLFSNRKPIVVAVQGAAVGAGLGLALVGDFRIAAPEARFSANFVKLGFHPGFGLTYTLPRLIGVSRADLMFQTGRRLKGEEALAWGLVDELVPLEQLRGAALRLALEIAENAPLAVQATRATMRAGLAAAVKAATDHEQIEQVKLRGTADFAEGIRAVAERRPGVFTGR